MANKYASNVMSMDEVARHNTAEDAYVAIDGVVFNVTKFARMHPGGAKVLLKEAGKDASKKFAMFHSPAVLTKYTPRLAVGVLQGSKHASGSGSDAGSSSSDEFAAKPYTSSAKELDVRTFSPFGNQLPHAELPVNQGTPSPYFSDSHREYAARIRAFVDKEVAPNVGAWDKQMGIPKEFAAKFARAGFLPGVVGAPWPTDYTDAPPPPGYDLFHEMVLIQELCRPGSGGFVWALFGGLSIGLPPVIKFGMADKKLEAQVARSCLSGEKNICLAITEPGAGSDVAGITTTARKSEDGRHYIVNGEKKWITNGVFADYFTTAVRTGGKGAGGISLLLIERGPGVTTKQMDCMGVKASGTTYITFEDVKVPVENVIGGEGNGFRCMMRNFNHERWSLCCQVAGFARVCLEEAFAYALKRKTFGKALVEHQVIRAKLAAMISRVEAGQSWLNEITYAYCTLPHGKTDDLLGGPIALLKAHLTQTLEFVAREAAQIFGGASYVRGGQGEKIERIYREVRAYAIPGGSEEIMMDLGARQAMRRASKL